MKTILKGSLRDGDTIVETTTTVETHSATIDYADILAACEIVSDDDYDPFDNDILTHDRKRAADFDHDASDMRGYVDSRTVVTVDRAQVDKWGVYDWARAQGASKQVAREMEALQLRQTIDQIATIYNGGAEAYGIRCDYMGEHSSCYGYDDYHYAAHSAIHDHASEVAYALEQRGYTVENKPQRERTRYSKQWELRHKLRSQSFVENEAFNYAADERELLRR